MLAGSAFVALVDIFIVSIVVLTGAQTSSGCQASQWQQRAAMIYLHEMRGADRAITMAIDAHVNADWEA